MKKIKNCCEHTATDTKCIRKSDNKIFKLPRKFTKQQCKKVKGFSMRSSCAPYKNCNNTKKKVKKIQKSKKEKKQFLFNPKNPKMSFDVYIDKNPKDTIPIKYTTIEDVKNTIQKLEQLYKKGKYSHKRIWQVGMILYVRLKVLKTKKITHFKLAEKYYRFLSSRSKVKNKEKQTEFKLRKKMTFTI